MNKTLKVVVASLMIVAMLLMCSVSVLAATETVKEGMTTTTSQVVQPMANTSAFVTVLCGETTGAPIQLPNYIGFQKEFFATATTDITDGEIKIRLVNPKGLDYGLITMGSNDSIRKTFPLPTAGVWHVYVTAIGTATPVTVKFGWS